MTITVLHTLHSRWGAPKSRVCLSQGNGISSRPGALFLCVLIPVTISSEVPGRHRSASGQQMSSISFTPPAWYKPVGVYAGALTVCYLSVKWLFSKRKDPPSLLSSLDPQPMASCAISESLSVVKILRTGRRAGCVDDGTSASIEHLQV